MKMLKLLRLMVFVACIAAFASGCGVAGAAALRRRTNNRRQWLNHRACRANRCGEDSRGERNTRNHPHGRW